MVSKSWRIVTWPILVAGLASPLLMDCGQLKQLKDTAGKVSEAAAGCPDLASVDAIAQADFSKLGLDVQGAAKMKTALTASFQLQGFAASIEADLKGACGKLAADLGAQVPADAKAEDTCKAAAKAIGEIKAKAGGSFKLSIKPPACSASVSAMADCSAKCDANVKGPSAQVKCEGGELSGECGAKCEGKCELSAGGQCGGSCNGSCDANFSGECQGKCDGKCDGKATGKAGGADCKGKCEGKCDAGGKGECKGSCKGSCELKGGAECKGTCSGKCSVEMKAPKCTGKVQPPEMSAECKGKCDAEVNAKVDCTPAQVMVKAEGSADAKAAEKLVAALQGNLPAVLKVAIGMKDKAIGVAANVKGVLEGVQGSMSAMVKGGPTAAAKLTACVGGKFTGAFDAAASIQANVNVSVNVQASASASGEAKAGK